MISQPHIFFSQFLYLCRHEFVFFPPGVKQNTTNNADSPITMLFDFVHILSQPGKYIFDIFQFRFRNTSFCFIHPIGQVGQQLTGQFTEIDDKIQRILYLVCNACTQQTQ